MFDILRSETGIYNLYIKSNVITHLKNKPQFMLTILDIFFGSRYHFSLRPRKFPLFSLHLVGWQVKAT